MPKQPGAKALILLTLDRALKRAATPKHLYRVLRLGKINTEILDLVQNDVAGMGRPPE